MTPAGSTAGPRRLRNAPVGQPLLTPLPEESFETGRMFTPRVDRYGQIPVRTTRYSVPIRLIGKRVRVVFHASHLASTTRT